MMKWSCHPLIHPILFYSMGPVLSYTTTVMLIQSISISFITSASSTHSTIYTYPVELIPEVKMKSKKCSFILRLSYRIRWWLSSIMMIFTHTVYYSAVLSYCLLLFWYFAVFQTSFSLFLSPHSDNILLWSLYQLQQLLP